jgi:hypothetical protein
MVCLLFLRHSLAICIFQIFLKIGQDRRVSLFYLRQWSNPEQGNHQKQTLYSMLNSPDVNISDDAMV